jgi:transcriptional regulator with XRE-family HTH domain
MKKIGQRLRDLRRSKNMKQEEVAKLLNISAAAYSKIETGVNEISSRHILTIKRHFNISTDWLLSGETQIDFQDFEENQEHVKKMLADMKTSKQVLFSMLSHYYEKIEKQDKTGQESSNMETGHG